MAAKTTSESEFGRHRSAAKLALTEDSKQDGVSFCLEITPGYLQQQPLRAVSARVIRVMLLPSFCLHLIARV